VILAVHVSGGALVGLRAGSAAGAFGRGVLSHGALDLMPHEDPFGERTEIVMTAATLALVAALTHLDGRAIAGAIGGALPDLEHLMPAVKRRGRGFFPTHAFGSLHAPLRTRFKPGAVAQLAIAAALLARLTALARDDGPR
jgi:hypothetical protein